MTPPGANTQTPVGSSSDYVCTNGSSSFDSGHGLGVASANTTVGSYTNPGSVPPTHTGRQSSALLKVK